MWQLPADNGRPFDHDAVFQQGAFADENLFADESLAFATVVQTGAQIGVQKGGNFRQSLPGITAAVENRGMPRLAKIEQFRSFEHRAKGRRGPDKLQ